MMMTMMIMIIMMIMIMMIKMIIAVTQSILKLGLPDFFGSRARLYQIENDGNDDDE